MSLCSGRVTNAKGERNREINFTVTITKRVHIDLFNPTVKNSGTPVRNLTGGIP
jgi:hypothetical protein